MLPVNICQVNKVEGKDWAHHWDRPSHPLLNDAIVIEFYSLYITFLMFVDYQVSVDVYGSNNTGSYIWWRSV